VSEGAVTARSVRGRVTVPTLHTLLGGADVQRGELGIALDELAARDAVTDKGGYVLVQRCGVGPEFDENVGLLLGQQLDLADVDRRRAQLEDVEAQQPQQPDGR
jgi:hypothetical protein